MKNLVKLALISSTACLMLVACAKKNQPQTDPAAEAAPAGGCLRMAQADLNELALLVNTGSPVHIVRRAADIPEALPGQS